MHLCTHSDMQCYFAGFFPLLLYFMHLFTESDKQTSNQRLCSLKKKHFLYKIPCFYVQRLHDLSITSIHRSSAQLTTLKYFVYIKITSRSVATHQTNFFCVSFCFVCCFIFHIVVIVQLLQYYVMIKITF